jgi:tetratricopeptide (TPR) repeat protein
LSDDRFAKVQGRAATFAWTVALVVMALSAAGFFGLRAFLSNRARRLDGNPSPLATSLAWPWSDFPGTTLTERARIEREFRIKEPVLAARVLPWVGIPDAPALRPPGREARAALETALAEVRSLPDPGEDGAAEDPDALEQRIDRGIDALGLARRSQPGSWQVDYDRGVLYLRRGNARAAVRELEGARKTIDRAIRAASGGCDRTTLYEASLHTRYALGHAELRIAAAADGDPAGAAGARDAAMKALSWALVDLYNATDECPAAFPQAAGALQVLPVAPTGLSSGALASDLIAGYLASPGFHRSEERPTAISCEPLPKSSRDEKSYRDRGFCRSLKRSAAPFDRLFRDRFDRFYQGDAKAWDEENLLWALSNAVDWTAENPTASLDDPYLLYNLGALLAQLGEFEAAASFLRQAQENAASLPPADGQRLDRLAAACAVLAGTSPKSGAPGRGEPSLPRALFRKLYPPEREIELAGGVRPVEFRPVGAGFTPTAESALDDWLFLQLWRNLLRKGELSAFEREYARALSLKGISRDFFVSWRADMRAALANRALARAALLEPAEPHKARAIRRFVSDDPAFPSGVRHQARGGLFGEVGWFLRTVWPWGIELALALLFVAAPLTARSLVAAHRRAFTSAYAAGRARDARRAGPAR